MWPPVTSWSLKLGIWLFLWTGISPNYIKLLGFSWKTTKFDKKQLVSSMPRKAQSLPFISDYNIYIYICISISNIGLYNIKSPFSNSLSHKIGESCHQQPIIKVPCCMVKLRIVMVKFPLSYQYPVDISHCQLNQWELQDPKMEVS